ncbi:hypothetical protein ZWY2020_022022 [Hordeum vulgare]|nr:hypothetical protein ZWY2020_022022 [Hordeum vulgare]
MWRGIFGGREDYEKRLQYLSKEEAAVQARMRRRTQFSRRTVRNIIVLSVVAEVHKQPFHIVYTDYRPTPLQHYVFPAGGDGLYLVVDENGKFRVDSSQKSLNVLSPASGNDKKRENGKRQKGVVSAGKTNVESDIFKMVKMIIQRQYDLVILFSFSKRECEFLAMQMAKMDLNGDDEKVNIETIFWSAMDLLSDDEKKLPQLFKCTIFFYIAGSDIIIFLISAFHLSYNMLLNQLRSKDGKVDSTQILHNLNEDELPGFEESWKGNAGQHLPGWNQNAGISNGDNSGRLVYSGEIFEIKVHRIDH